GNANAQTLSLLREQVLPRAEGVPVVAGVFAPDPLIDLREHLRALKALGVAGVTNWPALGFVDGRFGEALSAEGVDVACEIAMLDGAREAGLAAFGFACTPEDAARFAPHSDALVLNLGLTRHVRDLSDRRDQIQQAIVRLNRTVAAVETVAPGVFCFAFGGPITMAEDFLQAARQGRVDGFAGGSVFERLPVQEIVESTIRRFRGVAVPAEAAAGEAALGDLVGRSAGMRRVFDMIHRIAPYDVSVCIEGESGSGKELVAVQLHRLSARAQESLVTLNCGAIPESLMESELFGHEKGAFTGADRRRLGKFELAHRGTLFLDEVGDLSPRAQVALLRALQQREITRVGGEQPLTVDVRIIAASHQRLPQLVREGRFRADLYYRLNQMTIRVPPLRERREDIAVLVDAILARLAVQFDRRLLGITDTFRQKLLAYDWPGNVRELEHVICRAAILEDGPLLDGGEFDPRPPAEEPTAAPPKPVDVSAQTRHALAVQAVRRCQGNKSWAASELRIARKTLYAWLRTPGEER
ncbi:MAG: sigma 54-interacting transcriptional regulator, partial [Phycisphaerae bacterium]|nr:sigma 54-interacting transcriptional regulator [Phycisphaerae bacterium]